MVCDQDESTTIEELVELVEGEDDGQFLFLNLAVSTLGACKGL